MLIITIIVSFILTVANTLALFVHVFKDKQQEGLTITTQEQLTAPPTYEYSERSLIYFLDGIGNVGDSTGGYYANYFMVALYDDKAEIHHYDVASTISGSYDIFPTNDSRVYQFQSTYQEDGGNLLWDCHIYAQNQFAPNIITRGGSIAYITYSVGYRSYSNTDFNVLVTLGLEFPDSPVYDWYIYFHFEMQDPTIHTTYGTYRDTTNYVDGMFSSVFTDTNPCILINPNDIADIIQNGSNDYIIELRRQIQQLQNSTQQQVQDAYQQGRLDGEDIGYEDGYQEGLNDANTYTFSNVIGSLIDGPVNAVMSLFDFEVLGVNLRGFFLSLITCAIVIAIIKIFM